MSKMLKIYILISILCMLSLNIAIAHRYIFSLEEKVNWSVIIIVGKLKTISISRNGEKLASINPIEFIKGKDNYKNIPIRYGNPYRAIEEDLTELIKNSKYIFFLKPDGGHYVIVGYELGYSKLDKDNVLHVDGENIALEDYKVRIRKAMRIPSPLSK